MFPYHHVVKWRNNCMSLQYTEQRLSHVTTTGTKTVLPLISPTPISKLSRSKYLHYHGWLHISVPPKTCFDSGQRFLVNHDLMHTEIRGRQKPEYEIKRIACEGRYSPRSDRDAI